MLRRMLPNAGRARAVRAGQVVLLVAAGFLFLQWAEAETAPVEQGREHLGVTLAAPIVAPRGPWAAGDVLTQSAPGFPLDLTPEVQARAEYSLTGMPADGHTWTATVRIHESDETGTWWSVERDLPVNTSGDRASVEVPLADLVAQALDLEQAAAVPGTLGIDLHFTHVTTLPFQGQQVVASRTATVAFVPDAGIVASSIQADDGLYRTFPDRPLPVLGLALGAIALLLQVPIAMARRSWPSWETHAGGPYLLVEGLAVPAGAARTDLGSLLKAAKAQHGVALVDPASGHAVLPGPLPLVATVPPQAAPRDLP